MATAKAERLLNLVIALVNSPRYRSALWIRDKVAGYSDAPNDEAFFRTFERDKQELRELGIPLQTPPTGEDGYRIPPVDFALPAHVLHRRPRPPRWRWPAGSGRPPRWPPPVPGRCGRSGTPIVRGERCRHGPRPRRSRPPPCCNRGCGPVTRRSSRCTPRSGPAGPSPSTTARTRPEPPRPRQLQPWGLVSFRGRWYVVGHDVKRGERRTFRLSRIAGPVKTVGRAGAVRPPAGVDLLAEVAASVERPADRTATVRIRSGRAAGLRRTAMTAQDSGGRARLGPGDAAAGLAVGHRAPDRRARPGRGRRGARRPGRRDGPPADRHPADDRPAIAAASRPAEAAGRPRLGGAVRDRQHE